MFSQKESKQKDPNVALAIPWDSTWIDFTGPVKTCPFPATDSVIYMEI